MREKFDDYGKQVHYISRLLTNHTDIKRKCQYCGNEPAEIKNNKEEPYKVQLICRECKYKLGSNEAKWRDTMMPDIPLIDLIEHLTNENIKAKIVKIDKDKIEKVNIILKSDFTKREAIKYLGLTGTTYIKFLDLYEQEIDKNIKSKMEKHLDKSRKKRIRNTTLKDKIKESNANNLSKLKYEKNVTTNDIVRLSNNQINSCSISLICNGKTNPKIATKCLLAEVFKVSVKEIFPNDILFDRVYNYQDYIDLQNNLRNRIEDLNKYSRKHGIKGFITDISNRSGIPRIYIYGFLAGDKNLNHDELEKLTNALKD